MLKIYYHPVTGKSSNIPWSRAEAQAYDVEIYQDGEMCHVMGHGPVKATVNGKCRYCLQEDLRRDYQQLKADGDGDIPLDPAMAMSLGLDYYYDGRYCIRGGHPHKPDLRTGRCRDCADARRSPRAVARNAGKTTYQPVEPCKDCGQRADRRVMDDRCYGCYPPQREYGGTRAVARKTGAQRYTPVDPCTKCGLIAERRTQDDRCYGCHPTQRVVDTERAAARKTGAYTYVPSDPCTKCGLIAERRTQDGRCYGCNPRYGIVTHAQSSPAAVPSLTPYPAPTNATATHCVDIGEYRRLADQYGPITMDHADAVALGLPIYRTGTACPRGHTAWRVSATGVCLECV